MTTNCRECGKPYETGLDEGEQTGLDPICGRCLLLVAGEESMASEEDAANEQANARMLACEHQPQMTCGGVWCFICDAQFAVILKPRRAKPARHPSDVSGNYPEV